MNANSSPTDARLIDSLTGLGGRESLISDLTWALEPERRQSVLGVFELVGARDHRSLHGERASAALIAGMAFEFRQTLAGYGCYRSRWNEFCVLFDRPASSVIGLLDTAAEALVRQDEAVAIVPFFGAVVLPDEASDPIEALMLADELAWARHAARTPAAAAARMLSLVGA